MATFFKKKYAILISVSLFIVLIFLRANKINSLNLGSDYFFYSKQALLNGINTSRGYGDLLGINSVISKIFFNKSLYLIYYIFNFLNIIYDKIITLFLLLIN